RYNWYVTQQITVRGVSDCEKDGNVQYAISAYGPYSTTCASGGVSGVNMDEPVARLEASPSSFTTMEGGASARVNIRIATDFGCVPPSNVNVSATSSDLTEGLIKGPGDASFGSASTFTFTPG